jgi:hypothetical protein
VGDRIGDLLDDGIGFLVANRVRNLGVNRPLAIGGARNLFANGMSPPHLASALLGRALAAYVLAAAFARAALGLAGAGIEAAITA